MSRVFTALVLPLLLAAGAAQTGFCDPELRSDRRDRLAYRDRNMRCEGRYVAPQSGTTTLNLISYTIRPLDFDPGSRREVRVVWHSGSAEPVSLRVSSLQSGVYYRLDTHRPRSETSFSWPTTVLHDLGLRGADLAFLARTQPAAGATAPVLLPVEIDPPPAGARRSLRLVVVPGRRLEELYMTVLSSDGRRVEEPRTVVGQRPYAPGRRIIIPLPAGLRTGVYRVRIDAEHGPRSSSSIEPYLFVP